jgi:hypothetical protein
MDATTPHVNLKIKLYPSTNSKLSVSGVSQKLIHFVRYMICSVLFKTISFTNKLFSDMLKVTTMSLERRITSLIKRRNMKTRC